MGDLRKNNRAKILEILFKFGPISRAEISEISGLTPPTITALMNELLSEGLVEEIGLEAKKSMAGRKRVKMHLIEDSKLGLGIELGVKAVSIGLINLKGKLLEKHTAPIKDKEPWTILEQTVNDVKMILAKYPPEKIIGIGVGATGLVDSKTGTIKNSPNLGWRNIPLREFLEKKLSLPVVIENNVRLMALGEEYFFHNWGAIPRLILIHVGYGIGCGIILNGQLYYGRAFGAGELGHTVILPGGPLCSCGKNGCLETLASGKALTALYNQKMPYENRDYADSLKSLMEDAGQGEPIAVEVLEQAGTYMGLGLVNLINLFAPDQIILHGTVFDSDLYTKRALELVSTNGFGNNSSIPIQRSQVQDELVILGAGALAIQKFLIKNELSAEV